MTQLSATRERIQQRRAMSAGQFERLVREAQEQQGKPPALRPIRLQPRRV